MEVCKVYEEMEEVHEQCLSVLDPDDSSYETELQIADAHITELEWKMMSTKSSFKEWINYLLK